MAAAAANSPSPAIPTTTSAYAPTSCEDCGRALIASGTGLDDGDNDDDDVMMDVDEGGDGGFQTTTTTGCGACGKHVCSHCSITNLG